MKAKEITSEIATVIGMLIVPAMTNPLIKEAHANGTRGDFGN